VSKDTAAADPGRHRKGAIMAGKTRGLSIIDKGLKVEGIFRAKGKLIVGGALDGTLIGDEVIIVRGGRVVAQAKVRQIVISGDFEGDVTAYESLKIMPTGSFCGNMVCKSLSLNAGGTLNGSVKTLEAGEETSAVRKEPPAGRVKSSSSHREVDTGGEDISSPG
jgi:cytoskeletal protein CcmA (bactofilin family)